MRLPRKDGLNIVPFIDVMLVLLAIVLSAATFISQGQIKINVPESSSATQERDDKKVQILLDSENRLHFDNKEISSDELKKRLAEIEDSTMIELVSDENAQFHAFVGILDMLKEKGHEKFSIQTKIKK